METLAYLLLSQDLEADESKTYPDIPIPSLVLSEQLSLRSPSGLRAWRSSLSAGHLLGVFSITWLGLSDGAIAQAYEDDGLYPSSVYAFSDQSYSTQYSSASTTYLLPESSIYSGGYAYIQPSTTAYSDDRYAYPCPINGYYPEPFPITYPTDGYLPIRPAASLQQGDSGEAVRSLQNLLQGAGYFSSPSTGYFGSATEAAVIAFQQDYGLIVDGIAGSQTIAALQSRY
ncbi:peptidoglycan-binding protein [Phormidium tenue FACHB-886]|nr:peptidoglycan-binding protein [Phormidium tenue FACHB-886]